MADRILVADDSRFSRRMLLRALPDEFNGRIDEVENGQQAVERFAKGGHQLVLLDLTMPVMDGFQALREIMAMDPKAKVVIVSADIQPQARMRCQEGGARAILPKPVKRETLKAVIDAILQAA